MAFAPALAVAAAAWLALMNPAALPVAGPVLLLWLFSPAIAWWISLPLPRREARLSREQTRYLGRIARKTWAYFETFVGPDDHWLPPDNYQEYRAATLAHRTSPTNMGLALLANLAAHDFGYIPTGQLLQRTANALASMAGLERHRGHFYNWYDTQTLRPMHPAYVSTVDSGNLAGHLLTLRPGLLALLDQPILSPRLLEGLSDTLGILIAAAGPPTPASVTQFQRALESAQNVGRKSDSAFRQRSVHTAEGAGKKPPAFPPYAVAPLTANGINDEFTQRSCCSQQRNLYLDNHILEGHKYMPIRIFFNQTMLHQALHIGMHVGVITPQTLGQSINRHRAGRLDGPQCGQSLGGKRTQQFARCCKVQVVVGGGQSFTCINPACKIKQFDLAFIPTGDSNDRFHFNASTSAIKSATSFSNPCHKNGISVAPTCLWSPLPASLS